MPRDRLSGHRMPVLCHGCAVAPGWACGCSGGPDRHRGGPYTLPLQGCSVGALWVLAALIGKGEERVNLYEAWGKFVRITTDDGQVFEGKATDYTSALDNDPDPASICIGDTELYENEIVSIEMLPT